MAIVPGEYKSQIGLDKLYYAPITADDAAAYTPGAPVALAPAATAKPSTTKSINTQYADDGVFDTSTAEGETKIEIEVTNLPLETIAALTGRTLNVTNGMLIEGSAANAPDMALSFRSKKSNGKYRYIQYLKGKFEIGDEEFATLEANPAPKLAKLTYTAVYTIHPFTTKTGVTEVVKVVRADEDVTASAALCAAWFTQVNVPATVV
jgi:phi13 family phage major tail protein